MRDEDLNRVFEYIGGIIQTEGAIPFAVGGVCDHIHILTTLPKTVTISDFVRAIKAKISKWLKTFYRRFFAQQFKRSCLPDGAKVGTVSLSPRGDWRMPSDASCAVWMKEVDML